MVRDYPCEVKENGMSTTEVRQTNLDVPTSPSDDDAVDNLPRLV
jgi:hypothetical protein